MARDARLTGHERRPESVGAEADVQSSVGDDGMRRPFSDDAASSEATPTSYDSLDGDTPVLTGAARRFTAQQVALDEVSGFVGSIVVDLDETLYLRNSTEQFIACAKPGFLAALVLKLLDLVRPWRFAGGNLCRDNWRVGVIAFLFPWTMIVWRRFCRAHAAAFVNRPLMRALDGKPRVIIATHGFAFVVRPMIEAAGLHHFATVSCRLLRGGDRSDGKIRLLARHLPGLNVADTLVVTDSLTDRDLLDAAKSGLLVRWDEARYEPAFAGRIYFPGDYVSKVKQPNQRALRRLVREDLIPWVLVGATFASSPLQLLGLVALFFSMWSVYEWGYFDNDQCALTLESDGVFTAEAKNFQDKSFAWKAFATAAVLGIAGILLLHPVQPMAPMLVWFAVLGSLAIVYRFYNRMDKNARVWSYLLLQLFRVGSILAVVAGGAVAWAFVLSQVLTRWVDYLLYRFVCARFGITRWPDRPQATTRLAILSVLLLPIVAKGAWAEFVTPATLILAPAIYSALRFDLRKYRQRNSARLAEAPPPA